MAPDERYDSEEMTIAKAQSLRDYAQELVMTAQVEATLDVVAMLEQIANMLEFTNTVLQQLNDTLHDST